MSEAKILHYFCRIEGEDLVCVVMLSAGGKYVRKEFREGLGGLARAEKFDEGALGC